MSQATVAENMEDDIFFKMIKEGDNADNIDTEKVISYLKNEIK